MKLLSVLIGITGLYASTVLGSSYVYDFSGGNNGAIGTSANFTSNGVTITAYGYAYNPSMPNNLGTLQNMYQKSQGGDEVGLGFVAESDHEINSNQFIQLDLSNLIAAGVNSVAIAAGSVQAGENWALFQSNTQGKIGSVIPGLSSLAVDFPNDVVVPLSAANPYLALTEVGNRDILLSTLKTPEPVIYLGLASLLGITGWIGRRRFVR